MAIATDKPTATQGDTNGFDALSATSMIDVLERMLEALEERARPIREEMTVLQQLLTDLRANQFLTERRQLRAAERQIELETT